MKETIINTKSTKPLGICLKYTRKQLEDLDRFYGKLAKHQMKIYKKLMFFVMDRKTKQRNKMKVEYHESLREIIDDLDKIRSKADILSEKLMKDTSDDPTGEFSAKVHEILDGCAALDKSYFLLKKELI